MADVNWMLSWRDMGETYVPGFFIGSEDEDGSHRRDDTGWPYSLYRKGAQPGVTDMVLCHGIQSKSDARALLHLINSAHIASLELAIA